MPLVFQSNQRTSSGITYADRTGQEYEYPRMYRNKIVPGERFVYYEGVRKANGGTGPALYFGMGTVGRVRPASNDEQRLVCEVVDFVRFPRAVGLRDEEGRHYETGGERQGFFQQGVRRSSAEAWTSVPGMRGAR